MKILILTEVFFPDTVGGAGKYTYHTAKGLSDKGHDIYVITRLVRSLPGEEIIDGIRIHRIKWLSGYSPLKPFLFLREVFKTFEKLSSQVNFDLMVFNQPLSAFPVILSKKSKNIPKIYNFLSSWADEFEIKSFLKHRPYLPQIIAKRLILFPVIILMRLIERVVILKADKIITLSQYMRNRLQYLYKVPDERFKMIPAGVDIDKFKPAPNQQEKDALRQGLGIPKEQLVLITARNLVPRMGLDNLILAFDLLAREKNLMELIICGAGFLEDKLKALVKKLGLSEKIKFTGSLSEENLVKYFQAADLFILPTQFLEGFGIATIEAMACGLPVLGTPVGGTIEVLGKFSRNFILSGTDYQSIAEGISEFIKNTQDRNVLSLSCRQFILENYSLVKFTQGTEKFYLSVAKKEG